MFEENTVFDKSIHTGSVIRQARIKSGLTLEEISIKVGITLEEQLGMEQEILFLNEETMQQEIEIMQTSNNSTTNGYKNFKIVGGKELKGEINVNTSKNGAMGLLCASLLNRGTTILRGIPKIEEVFRMIEVFKSIGVEIGWENNPDYPNSLRITPPIQYDLSNIDRESASRTRSILMVLGALIHFSDSFIMPHPSGCDLGDRTVKDHIEGLKQFGVNVQDRSKPIGNGQHEESFDVTCTSLHSAEILMLERGDTSTENLIIAAAGIPGKTVLDGVSANYMVREVCYFLQALGVTIEGLGTHKIIIHGQERIDQDGIIYYNSEDPIEAMTLITAGIVTNSEIKVNRCPWDFIKFELNLLGQMGLNYETQNSYLSHNGRTDLVDIKLFKSELNAVDVKIKPQPYPGINPDNAPFFVLIATQAHGRSIYNDWMFNGRNRHLMDLTKMGARFEVKNGDQHQMEIIGKTPLKPQFLHSPNALRPTVIIMLAMLGAEGISRLINTYQVYRGYQDLPERLNELGANILITEADESE